MLAFGFGEYCARIAEALSRDVELLYLNYADVIKASDISESRVRCYAIPKNRLRNPVAQLRTMLSIHRAIRQFDADILHVQAGHLWFNASLFALGERPLVLTVHDALHHPGDAPSRKCPQWLLDAGIRRADKVIVHAAAVKKALCQRLKVSESKVHVVPHVQLGNPAEQAHVRERPGTVLFFGRIWPYKGLEYLIRAEPFISARVPNARFVIAGQGEDLVRYRTLMAHPERFEVLEGYIHDEQRTRLFREASVIVLPYVEASQSGVIPLAYTFEKPVIATTVGGLAEMVEDLRTGCLVPPRDVNSLAEAIVRFLTNDKLRENCGRNGHRKIETECSPQVVAAKTLAVYESAVASPRKRFAAA